MRYAERLKCGEKNRVAKRYSELSRHLHILIQNLADRLLKHNGEPIGFFHLLCIEAEHRLVNIPLKVCLGNEVISSEDNPLEMSPKAFNTIG